MNKRSAQTNLFRTRVRDVMVAPLPAISEETDCRTLVRMLRDLGQDAVIVTKSRNSMSGLVGLKDVVNRAAFRLDPGTPVSQIMTTPVVHVQEADYLFEAIAKMRRNRLKLMPVVTNDNRVTGTLYLEDAIASGIAPQLSLTDKLSTGDSVDELRGSKLAQVDVARTLLDEGVNAVEVQGLLAQVNNELYKRLLKRIADDMALEGWGEAPVAYDVIIMGSGGRGESFLYPDQDNGMVLDDYPDQRHRSVDSFFIELAKRLSDRLHEIGIPYCKGFVMATNPLWRKSVTQWQQQIESWLRQPKAASLRLADIFFDFQPVYGDGVLSYRLRKFIADKTPRFHGFLQEMQTVQNDHGVALGLFKRLGPGIEEGMRLGRIDLKYQGLLPLVEAVRLLALKAGIVGTGTLERMEQLNSEGLLEKDDRDQLTAAFIHLTGLILRQQLQDLDIGFPVDATVSPRTMSRRERDLLVEGLQAIDRLRRRLHSEFTGQI